MSANTSMVARPTAATMKPLKECTSIAEAMETNEFLARLKQAAPRHLSPERMLRVLVLAVSKTPDLAKAPFREVLGAMLTLSSLGLEPNTPMGLAYLIPFKKGRGDREVMTIQVIIGYRGYLDLMRRTGTLVSAHADVVYEGDEFSFEYGSNMHLRHVPRGDRTDRKPLWAYAHVKLKDGEAFEVLPYPNVLKIRDGSQAYQFASRDLNAGEEWKRRKAAETPWIANEHEMAAKTMIRRISKMVPMSIEFANAAQLDAMAETGTVDLSGALSDGFNLDDVSSGGGNLIEHDDSASPPPPPPLTTRKKTTAAAPPPPPVTEAIDENGVVTEGGEQSDDWQPADFMNGLLSLIKGATTVDALNIIMEHAEEELARLDADSRGEMHHQANARKKDLWDAEEAARKAAEKPKPAQATVAPPPPPAATGAAASPAPDDLMAEPYTPAKGDALEYRIRTRFNACQTKGALQSAMREGSIGQALGHLFMKDKPRHKAIMATKDELTKSLPERLPVATKEVEKIDTGAASVPSQTESEDPTPAEHRQPADVQQPQGGLALGATETMPSAENWDAVIKSKTAAIRSAPDEERVQEARKLSPAWHAYGKENDPQAIDDIWREANARIATLREGK